MRLSSKKAAHADMDGAAKQEIPVHEASLFEGMDEWSDSVAGAYVWLRIFMLARDLGAKDRVSRMVYSGDINQEKSCSGPVWTRRFFSLKKNAFRLSGVR
jgi:hypothetical protein